MKGNSISNCHSFEVRDYCQVPPLWLLAPGKAKKKNLAMPLGTAKIILDPGTIWRTQVSFTPRHFQLVQAYIIIDFILTKFVVGLQGIKQIQITIHILY